MTDQANPWFEERSTWSGEVHYDSEQQTHVATGKYTEAGWTYGCARVTLVASETITLPVSISEDGGKAYLDLGAAGDTAVTLRWPDCGFDGGYDDVWTYYARETISGCSDDPGYLYGMLLGIPTDNPDASVSINQTHSDACPVETESELPRSWSSTVSLTGVGSRPPTEPRELCENPPSVSFDARPNLGDESKAVVFRIGSTGAGLTYSLRTQAGGAFTRVSPGDRTYVYDEPGEYTATLKVRDADGCTASASDRFTAGAVTAYSPTVFFHPKEKYFPDSAQSFISRSQLIHWRPRICGGKKYYAAGTEARDIGGVRQELTRSSWLSGRGDRIYTGPKMRQMSGECIRFSGQAKASGSPTVEFTRRETSKYKRSSGFYLNLLNEPASWRRGSLSRARIYYLYKPEQYVAYWIFSPFNKWQNSGVTEIHEGDWEHYVIRLGTDNRARESAFFQHNCAPEIRAWDKTPRDEVGSPHPALFPALGGHASYNLDPRKVDGNMIRRNCSIVGGLGYVWSDRVGKGGKVWRPWDNGQLTRVTNHAWYGFGGGWGDRSSKSSNIPGVDNYGPPAPGPRNKGLPRGW